MAKRPRSDRDNAASGQLAGSGPASMNPDAARGPMLSAEADEAVFRLARLMGRQIAREQFEQKQATKGSCGQHHLDSRRQP